MNLFLSHPDLLVSLPNIALRLLESLLQGLSLLNSSPVLRLSHLLGTHPAHHCFCVRLHLSVYCFLLSNSSFEVLNSSLSRLLLCLETLKLCLRPCPLFSCLLNLILSCLNIRNACFKFSILLLQNVMHFLLLFNCLGLRHNSLLDTA